MEKYLFKINSTQLICLQCNVLTFDWDIRQEKSSYDSVSGMKINWTTKFKFKIHLDDIYHLILLSSLLQYTAVVAVMVGP